MCEQLQVAKCSSKMDRLYNPPTKHAFDTLLQHLTMLVHEVLSKRSALMQKVHEPRRRAQLQGRLSQLRAQCVVREVHFPLKSGWAVADAEESLLRSDTPQTC